LDKFRSAKRKERLSQGWQIKKGPEKRLPRSKREKRIPGPIERIHVKKKKRRTGGPPLQQK